MIPDDQAVTHLAVFRQKRREMIPTNFAIISKKEVRKNSFHPVTRPGCSSFRSLPGLSQMTKHLHTLRRNRTAPLHRVANHVIALRHLANPPSTRIFRLRSSNEQKMERSDLTNLCGYKRNLLTHEKQHAGTLPFHCCGKSFQSNRRRHRFSVHGETKVFVCGTYHKEYSTMSGLKEHERYEQQLKYSCYICGRKACKLSALRSHMATHGTDKKKKCRICNAAYKHGSSLSRHMRQKHK